jgi:hypothetical protein
MNSSDPQSEQTTPAPSTTNWGTAPNDDIEKVFLEGPKSRTFEFFHAFQVFFEMLLGFRKLHFVGTCVTVFDVGGNKIEYGNKIILITHVLTHTEYDKNKWKE